MSKKKKIDVSKIFRQLIKIKESLSPEVFDEFVNQTLDHAKTKPVCISETQYLENLDWAAKSYNAAFRGKPVPCRSCEKEFELLRLFRCFHCGSYFCPNCAREHFGKREESLHNAAMLANRNVAEVS